MALWAALAGGRRSSNGRVEPCQAGRVLSGCACVPGHRAKACLARRVERSASGCRRTHFACITIK